jgi:hypothetical protein
MRHAYKEYGEAQIDLVNRIKNIHDKLVLLARLISHGEQFGSSQELSITEYIASVTNQITALGEMVRASEFGIEIDHLDISERVAQFSAESLVVLDMLRKMRELPSLTQERKAFESLMNNFDEFAENLSQDPSRPEVLSALKTTQALQANINALIEAVHENPLVRIAECWFDGAVAVNALSVGSKNTQRPD